MDRRGIWTGLIALMGSMLMLTGSAWADGGAAPPAPTAGQCTINTLPSFVAQGEYGTTASVADVIEIGCNPSEYGTGSEVVVEDPQLYSRCSESITWYVPPGPNGNFPPFLTTGGRGVRLVLDADGNATVALIAGPKCQAGETLITAHEVDEPFESFATGFTVLPPNETPEGVSALPASQIENAETSTAVTIVEAEFPGASEDKLRLGSEELNARCRGVFEIEGEEKPISPRYTVPGGAVWVHEDGEITEGSEVTGLQLDDDGNAFALAIGNASCYPGSSLIEADLESKPFTTATTGFEIVAPAPRN
jgi:hypothetical protein